MLGAMTGAEHYVRAEELLRASEHQLEAGEILDATLTVHQAQTHAMLADVSARIDISAALATPEQRRV